MPMNYLLVCALTNYASYYGDNLVVECPVGSGNWMNLQQVADEISRRLITPFEKDETGHRLVNDYFTIYRDDPNFRELILFFEYFHGDTARGVGAAHQTGWTGIVAELINRIANKSTEKKLVITKEEVIA